MAHAEVHSTVLAVDPLWTFAGAVSVASVVEAPGPRAGAVSMASVVDAPIIRAGAV